MEASDLSGGFSIPDLSGGVGLAYLATGWKVSGDELFAELEWDKNNGLVTEEGSFKLYHRPE